MAINSSKGEKNVIMYKNANITTNNNFKDLLHGGSSFLSYA